MEKEEYENKMIQGDAIEKLKQLPDESVNCCITSPPYFNLKDYQVEGQIGLEKTWQEYIKKLIDIFDEVKRILKKDGTCFVNLGDTFSAKSLMMIPERFALEMIDRNWILRNKLVWIKRNAMPESVNDRWKKAHEYIFFFTKSKKYYFDLDSIRTKHKEVSIKRAEYEQRRNAIGINLSSLGYKSAKYGMPARVVKLNPKGAIPPDFLDINNTCRADDIAEHCATYPQDLIMPLCKAGCPINGIILDPFVGSGTTALVAKKLGKNYIGIELNENYVKIAEKRLAKIVQLPLL